MRKSNILIDGIPVRVYYNAIGVKYFKSQKSKHLKGCDLLDKSTQYKNSIRVANSMDKTLYVKINEISKQYIKLDKALKILKHYKHQYIINNNNLIVKYNDYNIQTYYIKETNACLLKHKKRDNKQYNKIYK